MSRQEKILPWTRVTVIEAVMRRGTQKQKQYEFANRLDIREMRQGDDTELLGLSKQVSFKRLGTFCLIA